MLMMNAPAPAFSATYSNQQDIIDSVKHLKSINGELLLSDEEEKINALIEQRVIILDTLMEQLKLTFVSKITALDREHKIEFLESRIQVNKKKGNLLAVQRDQMDVEKYRSDISIRHYLKFLIESSKNYKSIEFISIRSRELLDASLLIENKLTLPDFFGESKVAVDLKNNYGEFLKSMNSYQDMLMYVIINPRKIASIHWFQQFSLLSVISYINHFDVIQSFNYKLAPFRVDTGGVFVSIIVFLLIYFSYPFVFKCTSWFVENYVLEEGSVQQELIYHDIRRPVRVLLVFFGLNLSAYAFFYKTDYRDLLNSFSFVIYSIIIIWLIFKVIDSFVLIQVEKLSKSNIELRKELFNLGVQTVKAIIVILILTFGLNHFGISLTAIASTLGIGGLAFALAAKDTLSNLFGGITILFDNVFRMGDWIKVDDFEGTVAEIGLRSVTIRTFDNALITLPNSIISTSGVKNWNRRAVGRRIKMHIGVTYECNMEDLRQCLQDIKDMLSEHPDISNPKQRHKNNKKRTYKFASQEDTHGIKTTQLVFMDRFNDFSIDILVYCFARTVQWDEWLRVKEDVLFKIADILEKNNLEFAYPTQVRIYRSGDKKEADEVLPFMSEETLK
jgi:MscS family membrane protein